MEISLDAIESLRERANITYRQAKEILEQTGGDLVEALIFLEENKNRVLHNVSEQGKVFYAKARRVAGSLHQTRVKIKVKDKTLVELPVTVSALGAAFFPKLAALGVIGLLVSQGSLEVGGHLIHSGENEDADMGKQEH